MNSVCLRNAHVEIIFGLHVPGFCVTRMHAIWKQMTAMQRTPSQTEHHAIQSAVMPRALEQLSMSAQSFCCMFFAQIV
jgi:hypothetical protein